MNLTLSVTDEHNVSWTVISLLVIYLNGPQDKQKNEHVHVMLLITVKNGTAQMPTNEKGKSIMEHLHNEISYNNENAWTTATGNYMNKS